MKQLNDKKTIFIQLLFFILGGVWWTCSSFEQDSQVPKPTKQALIEEAVEEKIAKFIRIRKKKCIENRLNDAVMRVDSILIERAKAQRDTVSKPPRPFKPERPEILTLEDTTPIAPILPATADTSIKINHEQ